MALFDVHNPWAFTFGILGNIISFMVFMAPLPTFFRIYKEKSTMGFDSLPYAVALFSSMLWMYYALLKTNATLLITINLFGCVIETAYLFVFLIYASKKARAHTAKILGVMNVGLLSFIFVLTFFTFEGHTRVLVVGWICVAFSVCVFAAPLSIVMRVVRTRSVEFMPLPLSFFLTLSAVMWFAYGLFQNDLCVALPNVLGFFLGMLQMLMYGIYRNKKPLQEIKLVETEDVINIKVVGTPAPENNIAVAAAVAEPKEGGDEAQQNTNPTTISVEPRQVNMQLETPLQLVVCAA